MSLEENIKQWITMDNNIKKLTNEIKQLRTEKELYNNNILEYISRNNLENATVKIGNEQLRFADINKPQPLTYQFICQCLCKYYDNDDEKVLNIIEFIKSQRNIKTIKEIKRSPLKS